MIIILKKEAKKIIKWKVGFTMNDERYIEEQLDKENSIKEKFNKLNFKDVGISKDETALGGSKI